MNGTTVLAMASLIAFLVPLQQQQSGPPAAAAPVQGAKHSVTVTFNYDFTHTPACPDGVKPDPKKGCVSQFIVYDISGGVKNRIKLFTVAAPAGATKVVNGITGKSPELVFEPGKHELAVTAQMNGGTESAVNAATVWIEIPPPATAPGSPAPPSKN